MNALSTVDFGVAAPARLNFLLRDLEGATIQKLMEDRLLNPGLYAVTLSLQRHDGARVMVCTLVASDTGSGKLLFRDSIYVTLCQPDAKVAYQKPMLPDRIPTAAPSARQSAFEWKLYQNTPNPFN